MSSVHKVVVNNKVSNEGVWKLRVCGLVRRISPTLEKLYPHWFYQKVKFWESLTSKKNEGQLRGQCSAILPSGNQVDG